MIAEDKKQALDRKNLEDKIKTFEKGNSLKDASPKANTVKSDDGKEKIAILEAELKSVHMRADEAESKLKEFQEGNGEKQVIKLKQRIAELEKEKQRIFDDHQQKARNESQIILMNTSKIEDITKNNLQITKKVAISLLRLQSTKLPTKHFKKRWLNQMPNSKRRKQTSRMKRHGMKL